MLAIHCRFVGPTDTKGARIIARADAPGARATIPYPYGAGEGEPAHRVAALMLVDKMGWTYLCSSHRLVGGYLPDGSYAFVWAPLRDES